MMTLQEALDEVQTHGKTCKCLSKISCEFREHHLWQIIRDHDANDTLIKQQAISDQQIHTEMEKDGWDFRKGDRQNPSWYIKRGDDWYIQIIEGGDIKLSHNSVKSLASAYEIANAIIEGIKEK